MNDTAVVRLPADSVRIPRSLVLRTDVQRGTRPSPSRVVLGTVGGAAVGTVAGLLLGVALECGGACDGSDYEGIAGTVIVSSLGLVTGAISGGIWGARKRYPRWVQATLAP